MKIETIQLTSNANNKGMRKMIKTLQLTFGTNYQSGQLKQLMWRNAWMLNVWNLETRTRENHWMQLKIVREKDKTQEKESNFMEELSPNMMRLKKTQQWKEKEPKKACNQVDRSKNQIYKGQIGLGRRSSSSAWW